jgi:hypothetical protein
MAAMKNERCCWRTATGDAERGTSRAMDAINQFLKLNVTAFNVAARVFFTSVGKYRTNKQRRTNVSDAGCSRKIYH